MPIFSYKCLSPECLHETDLLVLTKVKPSDFSVCEKCGEPSKKNEVNPVGKPQIH
jgi:predicted nucleic acid-binding Zn ribbon protein